MRCDIVIHKMGESYSNRARKRQSGDIVPGPGCMSTSFMSTSGTPGIGTRLGDGALSVVGWSRLQDTDIRNAGRRADEDFVHADNKQAAPGQGPSGDLGRVDARSVSHKHKWRKSDGERALEVLCYRLAGGERKRCENRRRLRFRFLSVQSGQSEQ
ncbi:hypothetical protein OH76DRAFT_1061301 [Lentinus brumalis]|uniref:Uncharacterized protein n=1 Tax=Lentinus brumalis TaxID=2498619 RepID=A0A371DNH1_9APHY|nr:hypothetical protein OH76DRAFT_1061301 [Polyporus brumalis]